MRRANSLSRRRFAWSQAGLDFSRSDFELKELLGPQAVSVLPDCVTAAEHDALLAELDPLLRRRRYERGHWDSVIAHYREVERPDDSWSREGRAIIEKVRTAIARRVLGSDSGSSVDIDTIEWLPVHVIDLSEKGFISRHVDSVKFSGEFVAGLSLVSDAVMRLGKSLESEGGDDTDDEKVVDMYLPRNSLYLLRHGARYGADHAVLGGEKSAFMGAPVRRERRLSLIFRDIYAPA